MLPGSPGGNPWAVGGSRADQDRAALTLEGYGPIAELVRTILSQNTNDRNRDVAYERLRAAFRYLGQFGAMLRDAHPVSERRFGLIYFGEASGLSLCFSSAAV